MTKRRVRIEEVARLANVSAITVSRALRNPDKVAEATRQRIHEAVERTGYVPNMVAGNLASRRSRVVAAVVPTVTNSIFADTVHGMSEVLDAEGYQLLLGSSGYSLDREFQLVSTALSHQCCGIIVTGRRHKPQTRAMLGHADIPVVEIWNVDGKPLDLGVGFSNYEASYAMVAYLSRIGYRRIAFASAPLRDNDRAMRRVRGYRQAVIDLGLEPNPEYEAQAEFGFRNGAEVLRQLLTANPRPEAVFFANDILAIGGMLECQRMGLRVPDDVAIAGFDDVELAGEFIPGLTTVAVPRYEIGKVAAEYILARVNGETLRDPVRDLGFHLVARGSTHPAPEDGHGGTQDFELEDAASPRTRA